MWRDRWFAVGVICAALARLSASRHSPSACSEESAPAAGLVSSTASCSPRSSG